MSITHPSARHIDVYRLGAIEPLLMSRVWAEWQWPVEVRRGEVAYWNGYAYFTEPHTDEECEEHLARITITL